MTSDEKTPRTTERPEGGGQGAAPSPSGDALCWSHCGNTVKTAGTYCDACEELRRTTLECTACGRFPSDAALIPADAKPGDQCPCCFIADMDCDGLLVEGTR